MCKITDKDQENIGKVKEEKDEVLSYATSSKANVSFPHFSPVLGQFSLRELFEFRPRTWRCFLFRQLYPRFSFSLSLPISHMIPDVNQVIIMLDRIRYRVFI